MLEGLIVKALGGFYYVKTGDTLLECRARGLFRKEGISPCVGDRVMVETTEEGKGYVVEILPRNNVLIRPPVANLDWLVVVVSTCAPVPNFLVIDKMIAIAEHNGIEPVLVATKSDLEDPGEIERVYRGAGFETFVVASLIGQGIAPLKEALSGKMSAFCGNSGVGKSSILNAIDTRFSIQTGDTSKKLGRGRHTTRHCELYELDNGGYIADTPGFSSLELQGELLIKKEELPYAFREFEPYLDHCQFTGCSHTVEKGCAVLQACQNGEIAPSRHESYLQMYAEVKDFKEWESK